MKDEKVKKLLMAAGGIGVVLLIITVIVERPGTENSGGILTYLTGVFITLVVMSAVYQAWILPLFRAIKKRFFK